MIKHKKLSRARISDLFFFAAVVAAFAATPTFRSAIPGFIALSLTFFAIWNRPIVFRFWAGGMTGFGTGMFLAGVDELQGFYLQRAEIIGWGGGPVLTAAVVKDEFLKYYRGLCKAVLNGKLPQVDRSRFTLELQRAKSDARLFRMTRMRTCPWSTQGLWSGSNHSPRRSHKR